MNSGQDALSFLQMPPHARTALIIMIPNTTFSNPRASCSVLPRISSFISARIKPSTSAKLRDYNVMSSAAYMQRPAVGQTTQAAQAAQASAPL
jgi:hypothetical protein